MRSIAIIGAGQAGLPLAFVLKKSGYNVTLFNNRTAEQIKNGRILSNQGMFNKALQLERKWELNFWDKECPWNKSVTFTLSTPGIAQKGIEWKGKTNQPYQSIDQRIKFSQWMNEFKKIGGNLVIQDVGLNELNTISKWHELTIIASGKGEVSQLFPRDDKRSMFNNPMRALACMYVKGMIPVKDNPGVRSNIIPGIGEYFTMPGLTLSGHCEMMLFEGIPDGAFDCWNDIKTPQEQLEKSIKLLKQYLPWEAEKCENLQLTDNQATLIGRYTPTVRQPIAKMPNDKYVLGMADTVVLNDPIAGQGANNAAKCAEIYINSIIERGNQPFDEAWMLQTFERYWQQYAQAATQWSNMLLLPPPPHVIDLLSTASKQPELADKLANGFDNPGDLFPWITSSEQTKQLIEEIEATQKATFQTKLKV